MTLPERSVAQPTVSLSTLLAGARPTIDGHTGIGLTEYAEAIVASGFPGLRGLSARQSRAALDGYIDQILEHDFADLGGFVVRNPAALRRWLTAYAAATATTASLETIRDAAGGGASEPPARSTTQPYRDVLQRLWLIEPIPAWSPTRNPLARLVGPPKHHLGDPALAARLLGLGVEALLDGAVSGPRVPRPGTLLGSLFESLVALSVRVFAQAAEGRVRHLRTKGGEHEVDLIVERADGRILAIETKLGRTIADSDVRHLAWLRAEIGDDLVDAVIVHAGPDAYRRTDGVAVIPAALLGP